MCGPHAVGLLSLPSCFILEMRQQRLCADVTTDEVLLFFIHLHLVTFFFEVFSVKVFSVQFYRVFSH
jgi:hypothetical protein